jgi:hypothetical protein
MISPCRRSILDAAKLASLILPLVLLLMSVSSSAAELQRRTIGNEASQSTVKDSPAIVVAEEKADDVSNAAISTQSPRVTTSTVGGQRRLALVIGNSEYPADVGRLKNPHSDARGIAQALEAVGFEVILGLDLDAAQMNRMFRQFSVQLNGSEVGLFYYSGHGFEVNGRNYIVPIDAHLSDASDAASIGLPVDRLLSVMESSARTRVLLLVHPSGIEGLILGS